MKHIFLIAAAAALLAAGSWTDEAVAAFGSLRGRVAYYQSQAYSWHGGYYDAAWGVPGPRASRPTTTSSAVPIRAPPSRADRSSPRPRGPPAPINSATITFVVHGKLPPVVAEIIYPSPC